MNSRGVLLFFTGPWTWPCTWRWPSARATSNSTRAASSSGSPPPAHSDRPRRARNTGSVSAPRSSTSTYGARCASTRRPSGELRLAYVTASNGSRLPRLPLLASLGRRLPAPLPLPSPPSSDSGTEEPPRDSPSSRAAAPAAVAAAASASAAHAATASASTNAPSIFTTWSSLSRSSMRFSRSKAALSRKHLSTAVRITAGASTWSLTGTTSALRPTWHASDAPSASSERANRPR